MNNAPFLESVSSRIGGAILDFCAARVGRQFHADELRCHVSARVGDCAPGSADRVLRDLRQRGAIEYTVLNRAASLYRVNGALSAADMAVLA
jgi:hypothetical protein